jgi:hypothetical protein
MRMNHSRICASAATLGAVSSVGSVSSGTGSDTPVPRLSKQMTRPAFDRRRY